MPSIMHQVRVEYGEAKKGRGELAELLQLGDSILEVVTYARSPGLDI